MKAVWLLITTVAGTGWAQMPPGLPHRDSYAIRKIDPAAPCSFEAEYKKIQTKKSDPRVAFVEVESPVNDGAEISFPGLCKAVSQQTEDGLVTYDAPHGFLQIISGMAVNNTAVAYFAGDGGAPGVMLYVRRMDDEWNNFVLAYREGKWKDVSKEYLGSFALTDKDYLVVPQYGRLIRVLRYDGTKFVHRDWLTWNGKQFVKTTAADAKKVGWRCPDTYRYFEPAERGQYCK